MINNFLNAIEDNTYLLNRIHRSSNHGYLLCVGTVHGVSAVILVGKPLLIKSIMA